jgi:hypothetical protein
MDVLKSRGLALAASLLALASAPARAAEPPKLTVKPLLCVLDKTVTSCMMSFDIRWKSLTPAEYCLNDSLQPAPLICWSAGRSGQTTTQRQVAEEFVFWLGVPAGTERLAEVKISVLRVDSDDRRRERRTRHVWDVL